MRLLLFVFLFNAFCGFSQLSVADFTYLGEVYGDNESYLGFNPVFTMLRNPVAPYVERHKVNGLSFDFNYKKIRTDQGKFRFNLNNKSIGDMLSLLNSVIKGKKDIYAEENTYLGTLFAQMDLDLNLNRGDGRVQYSLGISHADYVYASRYTIDSLGGQFTMDPQGWYLTFGPHAMVNVVINEFLLAEFSGGYGFTYEHPINLSYAYKPSISYPNPGFGNVKLELDSKWGFYACAQYNWIHNKGPLPSAGKRLDLFLGFRFMLEKSS